MGDRLVQTADARNRRQGEAVTLFDDYRPSCMCGDPCKLGIVHREDAPCFVYIEPDPPDVAHLGRFQAHSSTSRRAALDIYPHTGTGRAKVLGFLLGRVNGATDEEIGLGLTMNPSTVRPRRIELVEGGWVRALLDEDGNEVERPTRSKSMAQVWEPTRKAHAQRSHHDPSRHPYDPI